MPSDAITAHPPPHGGDAYGIAYVFMMACAGHVERTALDPNSPDSPPFGCFDAAENQLGSDAFVFGLARIYAFDTLTNTNPVLSGVAANGVTIDPTAGLTIPHCTQTDIDKCTAIDLDSNVPASSQEPDPASSTPNHPVSEQVWVAYFVTGGKLKDEIETLYDANSGRVASSYDEYRPPLAPAELTLWAVVHDNRGGATWLSLPIHVQ